MRYRPVVHFIWLGSPLPEFYAKNLRTFAGHGYNVKLWTQPMPNMVNEDIFNAFRSYAGKADVMRLEILYKYGGLYSDTDSCMLRPYIIKEDLVCMTSASGYIANETIYAKARHPALLEAITNMKDNVNRLIEIGSCNIWDIAGATYITPIFEKYPHVKYGHGVVSKRNRLTPQTSIAHSYDGSWTSGLRKDTKHLIDYWLNLEKLNAS